jgi:pimeloyl-ACP methyl ester carboxylesterase
MGTRSEVDEARYREAERALWASVGAAPSEQFVTLPQIGSAVRVIEVGEGPPVVFVHGGSNAGTSWAHLAAQLPGFRCLLVDRPGCGLSAPLATRLTDQPAFDRFADTLVVDLLDALGLATAHLVVTSFGGFIGLRSTAAHPDRIDRLVVLSWPMGAPIAKTPLAMRLATLPRLGRLAARMPANERMATVVLKQIGLRAAVESGRFGPEALTWFVSLQRHTPTMRNEIDALPRLMTMRGMNESLLHPAALLASISRPTLFLWGRDDPQGGEDLAAPFAAQVPGAELRMVTGGHAPWIDDPEGVAGATAAFLSA